MEVVKVRHQGLPCLLPASQVERATEEIPEGDPIELWENRKATEDHGRSLVVRTSEGPGWIRCSEPILMELPGGSAFALSPFLKGLLRLPHLVGWTLLDEELVWLVDLVRWSPRTQSK